MLRMERRRRLEEIDPAEVRRILVRAPNWVGDLLMATPALRAIRQRFPEAELVVMARGGVAEACAGVPGVARVVRYDPRREHRALRARLDLARALRRERFDLAVVLPRSFGSALWALASGARRRVGQRGDARAWLLTDRLPAADSRAPRHHVRMFYDLARELGAGPEPGPMEYEVREADAEAAREILRGIEGGAGEGRRGIGDLGDGGGRPRVAIHPGASKAPRGWHAERWHDLAARLAGEWGARVLVMGGPGDAEIASAVAAAAGALGASLAGRSTFGVTAALLSRCDLLVANDSGAMHLAAAVGTPVVAIFGPGSPVLTGPWIDPARFEVVSHRFPCSPCRQRFFRECDPAPSGKPYCIESVTVDEVWEACRRLRARSAAPLREPPPR